MIYNVGETEREKEEKKKRKKNTTRLRKPTYNTNERNERNNNCERITMLHTSQYHLDREHRKRHQLECFLCECRIANRQISFPCGKTLRSSRCM